MDTLIRIASGPQELSPTKMWYAWKKTNEILQKWILKAATEYADEDADTVDIETRENFDRERSQVRIKIRKVYEIFDEANDKIIIRSWRLHGIKVDQEYLTEAFKEFEEKLIKIEKEMYEDIRNKKFIMIGSPETTRRNNDV